MQPDRNHRPHRVPPDPGEMARRIAAREALRLKKIEEFKLSNAFRLFNILNVCCFFIYWELVFCFFGPCSFKEIVPERMEVKYGAKTDSRGFRFIREIELLWYTSKSDKVIVNSFVIAPPQQHLKIRTGRDFILLKDLKVKLGDGNASYRLNHSSPLVFLCVLLIVVNSIAYTFNLNQSPVVLNGLSMLNLIVLAAICFI